MDSGADGTYLWSLHVGVMTLTKSLFVCFPVWMIIRLWKRCTMALIMFRYRAFLYALSNAVEYTMDFVYWHGACFGDSREVAWTANSALNLTYTMPSRGAFIVIEGLDRAGKSTQAARLHERLSAELGAERVKLVKFPGKFVPRHGYCGTRFGGDERRVSRKETRF